MQIFRHFIPQQRCAQQLPNHQQQIQIHHHHHHHKQQGALLKLTTKNWFAQTVDEGIKREKMYQNVLKKRERVCIGNRYYHTAATGEGTAKISEYFEKLQDYEIAGLLSLDEDEFDPFTPPSMPPEEIEENKKKKEKILEKLKEKNLSPTLQVKAKMHERTGWTIAPITFSTQRLNSNQMAHQNVVVNAIKKGVHFLEANAFNAHSEYIINDTLTTLREDYERYTLNKVEHEKSALELAIKGLIGDEEFFTREKFIISTKGGFELVEEKNSKSENYSLDPIFIRNQIFKSLKNMNVKSIDLFFIDRPEILYFQNCNEEQIYEKITTVFKELESLSSQGYISYYGVCSQVLDGSKPKFALSLDEIVRCAEKAGGQDHKFVAVQFPFNMIESDAYLGQSSPSLSTSSLIATINKYKLISVVARPISVIIPNENVYLPDDLIRLISYPLHDDKDIPGLLREAIEYTEKMEQIYEDGFEFRSNLPNPSLLKYARVIEAAHKYINSIASWKIYLDSNISPVVEKLLNQVNVNSKIDPSTHFCSWPTRYSSALSKLFERVEWSYEARSNLQIQPLINYLEELDTTQFSSNIPVQYHAYRIAHSAMSQSIGSVSFTARNVIALNETIATLKAEKISHEKLAFYLTSIRDRNHQDQPLILT